jgi:exopolyphosphatase/pppGpp-phosphohydrolase
VLERVALWLKKINEMGVPKENIKVIATAAVREAYDREDFINRFKTEFLMPIRILSHKEEARLGVQGMLASHPNFKTGTFLELGGGSGQFVIISERTMERFFGLQFGMESLKHLIMEPKVPFKKRISELQKIINVDPGVDALKNFAPKMHQELVLAGGIYWKLANYSLKLNPQNTGLDFFEISHHSHPHLSPYPFTINFREQFLPLLENNKKRNPFYELFAGDQNKPNDVSALIALQTLKTLTKILQPSQIMIARGAVDDGIIANMLNYSKVN